MKGKKKREKDRRRLGERETREQIDKGVRMGKRKERKRMEGKSTGPIWNSFLFPPVEPSISPGTVSVRFWTQPDVGSCPCSITYWSCAFRQGASPLRH